MTQSGRLPRTVRCAARHRAGALDSAMARGALLYLAIATLLAACPPVSKADEHDFLTVEQRAADSPPSAALSTRSMRTSI
jgi:hypothetical protein